MLACELERLVLNVNNRFPYIQIAGPLGDVETQTYKVSKNTLLYEVRFFDAISDKSEVANTEVAYIARNVYADITKALMEDHTRNGLADFTKLLDFGYDYDLVDDRTIEFFVYITVEVLARIDTDDPYLIG